MARPLRIEYPGHGGHVTIRGNERGEIFQDDKDRGRTTISYWPRGDYVILGPLKVA